MERITETDDLKSVAYQMNTYLHRKNKETLYYNPDKMDRFILVQTPSDGNRIWFNLEQKEAVAWVKRYAKRLHTTTFSDKEIQLSLLKKWGLLKGTIKAALQRHIERQKRLAYIEILHPDPLRRSLDTRYNSKRHRLELSGSLSYRGNEMAREFNKRKRNFTNSQPIVYGMEEKEKGNKIAIATGIYYDEEGYNYSEKYRKMYPWCKNGTRAFASIVSSVTFISDTLMWVHVADLEKGKVQHKRLTPPHGFIFGVDGIGPYLEKRTDPGINWHFDSFLIDTPPWNQWTGELRDKIEKERERQKEAKTISKLVRAKTEVCRGGRRQKEMFKQMQEAEMIVLFNDSLAGGNCPTGTRAWARQHNLDYLSTPARVLIRLFTNRYPTDYRITRSLIACWERHTGRQVTTL